MTLSFQTFGSPALPSSLSLVLLVTWMNCSSLRSPRTLKLHRTYRFSVFVAEILAFETFSSHSLYSPVGPSDRYCALLNARTTAALCWLNTVNAPARVADTLPFFRGANILAVKNVHFLLRILEEVHRRWLLCKGLRFTGSVSRPHDRCSRTDP